MAVKKIAVFALLALTSLCFAQNINGKRITVPEPTMQFGGEGDAWIPLFVQGQITSNLLNYSGMDVIDRQAIDKAIKEQKLSVSAAYAEEDQIQIGKLLTAHYIVVVSIIKKGSDFSLDAKITDAESGVAIGKAYNNPNCSAANMENGSAINELSYQLMAGLGVDKKNLDALHTASENQKKEIIANTYLAKGIATEKSGGSVVEALAYYQKAVGDDSGLKEAANRMNNMTTRLSTGSIKERILRDFELRDEWAKIWADFEKYASQNCPYIVYYPALTEEAPNYEKRTIRLVCTLAYAPNKECVNLYVMLFSAYYSLQKQGFDIDKWGIYITTDNRVNINVALNDKDGNEIGSQKLKVSFDITNPGFTTTKVGVLCPIEKIGDNTQIVVTTDRQGGVIYASK